MAQAKTFWLDVGRPGTRATVRQGVEHAISGKRAVIAHRDDNNAVEIRPQRDGTYDVTIYRSGRQYHAVKARTDEELLHLARRTFGEEGRSDRPPRTRRNPGIHGSRSRNVDASVGDTAWGAMVDGALWAPFNSMVEASKFARKEKKRGGRMSVFRVRLDANGKWNFTSSARGTSRRNPGSGSSDPIAAFRRIVKNWQAEKVDGVLVDAFSASAIVQVYDKLNETNRAKFLALPAHMMAIVAFKVLKA